MKKYLTVCLLKIVSIHWGLQGVIRPWLFWGPATASESRWGRNFRLSHYNIFILFFLNHSFLDFLLCLESDGLTFDSSIWRSSRCPGSVGAKQAELIVPPSLYFSLSMRRSNVFTLVLSIQRTFLQKSCGFFRCVSEHTWMLQTSKLPKCLLLQRSWQLMMIRLSALHSPVETLFYMTVCMSFFNSYHVLMKKAPTIIWMFAHQNTNNSKNANLLLHVTTLKWAIHN